MTPGGALCNEPSSHLWTTETKAKQIGERSDQREGREMRRVPARTIKRHVCLEHALRVRCYDFPHISSRKAAL